MANKSGMDRLADLAHHAKALKDIIKAALRGGWHAAALPGAEALLASDSGYCPHFAVSAIADFPLPAGHAVRIWQFQRRCHGIHGPSGCDCERVL